MRRVRVPLVAGAVTLGVVTAVLAVPAGPASASMLDITAVCDAGSRTVTAGAAATPRTWLAGRRLNVEFRMVGGSHASAGTSGPLDGQPPLTVPVTVGSDGSWSATGYARPWAAPGDDFYLERIQVRVLDPATNGVYLRQDAVCYRDNRTTVTFDCDGAGRTDVRVAGVRYPAGSAVSVAYYRLRWWTQSSPDVPAFVGQTLGEPTSDRTVTVVVEADGTWSDPGIQRAGAADVHYAATEYRVVVSTPGMFNTYALGRGEGLCVSVDRRSA